jgi:hypothetical protein
MAGNLKQFEFTVSWQTYRVGDRITPNASLRDWLVANGYGKIIEAPGLLGGGG